LFFLFKDITMAAGMPPANAGLTSNIRKAVRTIPRKSSGVIEHDIGLVLGFDWGYTNPV
jgi:hypothetical protein